MITARDNEIFELMSVFGGKTFLPVLAKTFFNSEQVARNRLNVLKKDKMIKYVPTGLMSPRNAIYPTANGLRYFIEHGLRTVVSDISSSTVEHLMLEQITYFYLKKIGKDVERTIVKNWREKHNHTPDLCYTHKGKNVYVEIERTNKRPDELAKIQLNSLKDDIHIILYVFEDEKRMKQLGSKIPLHDKIYYVTIGMLIVASKDKKIGAVKQLDFLKNLGDIKDER